MFGMLIATTLGSFTVLIQPGGLVGLAGRALGVMITGLILLLYYAVIHRRAPAIAIGRCVAWGICPACGYPLTGAAIEDDGCRVCPECGAAWRSGAER
jgi:hypothetical protein